MKKLIITVVALLAITLISPTKTQAAPIYSGASARLATVSAKNDLAFDLRVKAVRNVLERYNSPIASEAIYFVKYADAYEMDWKLLPAISGLESSFGRFLMPQSHNAYGWGGGYIYFDSWEEGIETVNKALKEKYAARGADSVWTIGPIYSESPTWAVRVNNFMNQISSEYENLALFSLNPTI